MIEQDVRASACGRVSTCRFIFSKRIAFVACVLIELALHCSPDRVTLCLSAGLLRNTNSRELFKLRLKT